MEFKKIVLGLAVVASLGLTACNKPATPNETAGTQAPAQTETEQETETQQAEAAEIKTMTGEELDAIEGDNKKKDEVVVVDVRPSEQYKEKHLKHAINVTLDEIKADPEVLSEYKETPIILYCNSGKMSGEAAQILAENGYKDITNAAGVKEYEYQNLAKYESITAKKFLEMKNDATVVDARPAKDYEEGHIDGAVSVPFDAVADNMDKIPEGKPVIAYCFTGNKSSEVATELAEKGYEVYNVLEGTKEYDYELVK
ncbi:rhodanese-like domain-containing protein [Lagierella massiliensis]|uniref:rhodanese-like domain-containing protein n=1 Tax=Lagierella massiliensis TaxID=1689303 RepID=UPI0006D80E54|nr:rhodanese-like domain-containing protein [Lagierella massiliensis]